MQSRFILDGEAVVISGNTKEEFIVNFARVISDRQITGEEEYPEGLTEDSTITELREYAEELWDEGQETIESGDTTTASSTQTITASGDGEVTISIVSQKKGNTGA